MELADALNVLSQVKSRYAAFEKLEEVFRLAVELEAAIKEKQAALKGLESRISEAKATVDHLAEANQEAVAAHEKLMHEIAAEAKQHAAEYEVAHTQRMAEADAEHGERVREHNDHLASLDKEIAEREEHLANLNRVVKEKSDALAALRNKLRSALDD